jgi:hypothetical protein
LHEIPKQALGFPTESASHAKEPTSGSKHLVVSISDAKTSKHIDNAKVSAEIRDPKGSIVQKLVLNETAGMPDYSEVFVFGYSGSYRIRIQIERPGQKSVRAEFAWINTI